VQNRITRLKTINDFLLAATGVSISKYVLSGCNRYVIIAGSHTRKTGVAGAAGNKNTRVSRSFCSDGKAAQGGGFTRLTVDISL
jgi:hypothetical protein